LYKPQPDLFFAFVNPAFAPVRPIARAGVRISLNHRGASFLRRTEALSSLIFVERSALLFGPR
jgi:hypothetical protein